MGVDILSFTTSLHVDKFIEIVLGWKMPIASVAVLKRADNIFVMRGGSVSGCLPRAEATEENVLTLAMAEDAGNERKEGQA